MECVQYDLKKYKNISYEMLATFRVGVLGVKKLSSILIIVSLI